MGNPSNAFTNFSDSGNLTAWYNLVTSLTNEFQHKYGKDYVQSWNFESWNEPDTGNGSIFSLILNRITF